MAYLTKLSGYGGRRECLEVFGGYDHNLKINEGWWYDEKNITSEEYPLFSTRRKRGEIAVQYDGQRRTIDTPRGLIQKDCLIYVDGSDVYVNDYKVPMGLTVTDNAKQLISMGAYLLIWPDRKYLNTNDLSDYGSIDNVTTATEEVAISLCERDGGDAQGYTRAKKAPKDPQNGDRWLDISGETPCLKVYTESTGMWTTIATTYVKLSSAGLGVGFSAGDGVELLHFTGERKKLNGKFVVMAASEDYIVITALLATKYLTQAYDEENPVEIRRKAPAMDYITECGNRIWGCRYSVKNSGSTVNEIYACKLGDFKNWNCFQGISTDSYAASRGSDGPFTGAATLDGHPLFFKEDYIEKVYPASNGAHQIVTTPAKGVQSGSWRSLQVVDGVLYYKSKKDVMAYTGSTPTPISDELGDVEYRQARAGAVEGRYYIAMRTLDANSKYEMLCYDTRKKLWHKEDEARPVHFAEMDGDLYYLDVNTKKIMCITGKGTAETDLEWFAESGVIGLRDAGQKYITRFVFRAELAPGSSLKMQIKYDEGNWIDRGEFRKEGLGSFVLPVAPRRCDHLRIRMSGKGEAKIYSVAKYWESGSDRVRRT
ncbi:MAG: hypothetical protein KBS74_02195 [Clostridiales bacterium]|nr:hypothetical protein [Candidatus Cacconaster stercorequi]